MVHKIHVNYAGVNIYAHALHFLEVGRHYEKHGVTTGERIRNYYANSLHTLQMNWYCIHFTVSKVGQSSLLHFPMYCGGFSYLRNFVVTSCTCLGSLNQCLGNLSTGYPGVRIPDKKTCL